MPSLSSSSSSSGCCEKSASVGFAKLTLGPDGSSRRCDFLLASGGGSREAAASEPNRGLAKESHHGLSLIREAPGPLCYSET